MSGSDYDFGDQPSMLGDETQPRTLYVGNLDVQMSEEFLSVLFNQIGQIKGCKIIHEEFLLVGIVALDIVSCVLWNVRPLVKVRLRPPRHQIPIAQHSNQVYHRAHSFGQRPHRMPVHHDTPVFSYRPPNLSNHGGPGYKMKHGPIPHSSNINNQNRFRGPPLPQSHRHFHQDEMLTDTKHKLIKFESPSSNLLENSGYTLSTLDDSQHGYLSPKYKGWKPISKPKFHGASQESKGDHYTYTPTTEKYEDPNGRHQKLMLTTLFRDNVKNIKPPGHVKLKSEYSENRGVAIPLPTELGGSSITLPASIFLERPQTNYNFYSPSASPSQSEEKPVIRKPFPRFQQKFKTDDKLNQSFNTGNKEGGELPQILSKFKNMRPPRVRPTSPPQSSSSYDNEPENDGIGQTNLPKLINPFPTKVPETSSQAPMTFKEKYNKVRTRIRTRVRQPDGQQGQGHVNTEDLRQVFTRQRPDPGPLGTSINPKEAFRDPQRQQEHNSLPYAPTTFSKNITSFSHASFPPKESHVSHHPDRTRGEYAWNKNPPSSNQGIALPEVSGNKISDEPNVGSAVGFNSGVVDKPAGGLEREKKRKPNSQGTRPESVTPFVYTDSPVYSEEFYLPPGFLQNPSLSGHKPVSFMTMPNSQPQVIHHTGHNGHPPQSPQQLYPINVVGSADRHKSKQQQQQQHYHQQHNDGTSPNSNYVQNNRPHFLFMNIQNGQLQPTGSNPNHEAPLFTPQTYDTGVTPQPFSHSTPFPTGSGGFHHHGIGTPKSREPSTAQHYHFHQTAPTSGSPSSTSPRNPYSPYSSDSRYPSHYTNQPNYPIDGDLNPHHHPHRIHQMGKPTRNPDMSQTYSHHPNNNLDAYASNEYKQIPMEFMNHLRPILLDEDSQTQSGSQTAPSRQNEYFSSELYPPNEYFDNFFKSYEVPNKQEQKHILASTGPTGPTGSNRHVAQPSGEKSVRVPYDSYKSSSNTQVQILELNSEHPNKTLSSSTTPRWSPPKHPIVSISPIHEYTFESTVSPIQDIELFRTPQGQKSWSKLKDSPGDVVGISSTELYHSPTSKYKRLIGQGSIEQSENKKLEIQGTTLRPIFSSSFSSIKKSEQSTASQSQSVESLKPTPSMVTRPPTPTSTEGEPVTVRNYRIRVTTVKPTAEVTGANKELEQSESSTQLQSMTRPLRRRKVGMHGHRFFTSARVSEVEDDKLSDPPVTTHRPRRLILSTSTGATLERPDDSSESFEVSGGKRLKSRRRFFNRRMNVHANRAGMIGLRATTPSAADVSDAVTYGESQWFRIKDLVPDVTESGNGESGKVSSSSEKLNSTPIEESTSKFSSRALSTTPDVKLEILEPLEMSSEKLIQSENSSGRNFYEGDADSGIAAGAGSENDGGGEDKPESHDEGDSGVRIQTEPMS